MSTRLFVGNLPENTSENELRSAFSPYGNITTLDLKTKTASGDESKKFAFVSISSSNYDIESCIKHFTNQDYNGKRLYVTRARESFLERLQREREQALNKENEKNELKELPKKAPSMKLSEKLNPKKRKFDAQDDHNWPGVQEKKQLYPIPKTETIKPSEPNNFEFIIHSASFEKPKSFINNTDSVTNGDSYRNLTPANSFVDKKKHDSEMKRIESMKKKREDFKEKQKIIKTGLKSVDKIQNKKIVFPENDAPQSNSQPKETKGKNSLFDGEDSGDEVDFAIKKQFEGKKGQKVLELQSRYKSDKRFTLDERFIEEEKSEDKEDQDQDQESEENEKVELEEKDEKNKQLDILQDVLGITLKRKLPQEDMKNKPKLGMLRFDPSQPEHAKFLAPVVPKNQEPTKKSKKKLKEMDDKTEELRPEEVRPEVSKEQFYKVSDTLKEAIAQPNTFSLRSLFGNNEVIEKEQNEDNNYMPLEAPKKPKMKNPLDIKDKNPFIYDSSESENEDEPDTNTEVMPVAETKAVWKESLFFSEDDQRLKDGLAFFNNSNEEAQKERRELKSLVKKRIYNKERKNQMFQKKIGGRRKTMKKSFRKKT